MTPKGWKIRPLGDVFEVQLGKMLSPKSKVGDDPRPYLRNVDVQWGRVVPNSFATMDFNTDERRKFRLQAGDLLVCEGGEVGRSAIWDGQLEECYYQKALHRLRPLDGAVAPKFMLYYLMLKFQVEKAFSGERSETTIAHLPRVRLLKLPVAIPPLPEQKKIAAVLGSVDEAIVATQAVIDQTRRVKQGLLAQLLTRGIGHTRFKKTEIGEIPEEWEVHELGDFIPKEAIRNGLYKPQGEYGAGTPIVRIDVYRNGDRLSTRSLKLVRTSPDEERMFRIASGDLLINRVNSLSHLGKAAIVGSLDRTTVFESNMMCVRVPKAAGLLPEYLLYLLTSCEAQKQILSSAKKAVAQSSINQQDVRGFRFAFPLPDEQKRIIAVLNSCEAVENTTLRQRRRLDSVKRGLMQDLLTGRVRVNDVS